MPEKVVIDPVTRVSGALEVQIMIEKNIVVDAKTRGLIFRGFEKMLKGRSPLDAIYFTERICGICSTAHGFVSALALEDALKVQPDENGSILRQIMHGCEFLQNHIRHFYQFIIPDYVPIKIDPSKDNKKYKMPKEINDMINNHYVDSFKYSHNAHKMLAILGGKAPHTHGIFVGGVTANIDSLKIIELKSILYTIKEFVSNVMLLDINMLAKYYPEEFQTGRGYGNFMTYGVFDQLFNAPEIYVKSGVLINNERQDFDPNKISEDIRYSYYSAPKEVLTQEDYDWQPDTQKKDAYSWIKAPRYDGLPMEVGPLARLWISGEYSRGISTLDRITARAIEASKVCNILDNLLKKVKLNKSDQKIWQIPQSAVGVAFRDTTIGALSHRLTIKDQKIDTYNILTPSLWNVSSEDSKGNKGVIEKALIGTYVEDIKNPTEIGKIIRAFDPCISCATHIISDKCEDFTIRIV